MTWFKVDDGFWGHPKQTALPPGPVALWVRAGSWSGAQLTDGFVPVHMVTMLGAKKRDAEQLVAAGLWEDVDGGFQFHDWAKWQPTRDDVEKKRAEDAERKAEWRRKKAEQRAAEKAAEDVSRCDSERTDAGTPRGVRSSRPDPTRPDPTRSSPTEKSDTSGTTSRGGSHVGNGPGTTPPLHDSNQVSERTPPDCGPRSGNTEGSRPRGEARVDWPGPLYSDRCSRHGNDAEPPNCGQCADVRKANAGRPLTLVPSTTRRCIVHDETYTSVCRGCRADEIAAEVS